MTSDIIAQCIKRLKRSKRDGNYGFKSDHLINGGKRLHIVLSMLFKSMLIHGYNANNIVLSSIISIQKDIRSSLSSSDNYRGISLFNGVCKLFDYVIMHTCNDYLYTSDMQFGFKPQQCAALFITKSLTIIRVPTVMENPGKSWKILESHGKSWKVMEKKAVMETEENK